MMDVGQTLLDLLLESFGDKAKPSSAPPPPEICSCGQTFEQVWLPPFEKWSDDVRCYACSKAAAIEDLADRSGFGGEDDQLKYFDAAGLSPDFYGLHLQRLSEVPPVQEVWEIVHGELGPDRPWCCYLTGEPGTGKTQQLVVGVSQWIKKRLQQGRKPRAYLINERRFIQRLYDQLDQPRGERQAQRTMDALGSCDLLAIDEFGAAEHESAWVRDKWATLIDLRYSARKRTLIASNYTLQKAGGRALLRGQPHLTQRIGEACGGFEAQVEMAFFWRKRAAGGMR